MIEGIESEMSEDAATTSGLLHVMEPAVAGFASVGGYQKAKDFLETRVIGILKHPDLAARLGLSVPRGILLFGPPGTGKTLLTRALAAEGNLPIIRFPIKKLLHCCYAWPSLGEQICDPIRLAQSRGPAIVYSDEIDKLLPRRSADKSYGASLEMTKVRNLVLEWLKEENRQCIVVWASNRPEDIDVVALRLVDYLIPVLYPDASARRDILMVHLGLKGDRPVPLALTPDKTESVIDFLAKDTEYFSGAELERLVNKAKRLAFTAGADALTAEHFYKALETTDIDRERRKRDVDHYLNLAREYATDSDLFQADCSFLHSLVPRFTAKKGGGNEA